MAITINEVAALVGGVVAGDGSAALTGLNAFDLAGDGELTFAGSKAYLDRMAATRASCVLVPADYAPPCPKTVIKVKDPKTAFAIVLGRFYKPERPAPGAHPTAVIAAGATLGQRTHVGAHAVIEEGASLGDDTTVGPCAVIGRHARIGARCTIHANVTIYHDITIGDDVIVHSGTVIGADGFGYVEHEGVVHKIPQTGTVEIGNGVEIGACVAIDRATFGATTIGEGSKIDNLCQIAHNAHIGRSVRVAGQSGVSGSTKVGDYAILAAQSGLRDNITIGERAIVLSKTGVSNNVKPGERVFGIPAREQSEAFKQMAALARLAPHALTLVRLAREREKEGQR